MLSSDMNSLGLGCDVGGTFTDAVLMDGRVVCAAKTLTTAPDPFPGIVEAVRTAILTPQIGESLHEGLHCCVPAFPF